MKTIEFKETIKVTDFFDVVVAGGGMSGVCAAVSAARNGARVCIIEQASMLGGLGTSGMMTMILGKKRFFGGLGREIISELKRRGATTRYDYDSNLTMPYHNEGMKRVLDDIIIDSGVKLLLYTKIIGVTKNKKGIENVILSSVEGNFAIEGKLFIDATGDGVLSCFAGEDFILGDENGNTQAPTMIAYYCNVDLDKRDKFASDNGGSLNDIIHKLLPQAVEEGVIRTQDLHHPGAFGITSKLAIVNAGHVYGADCVTAEGLTNATIEGRKQAEEYYNFYKRYIPGFEKAILTNTASWLGIRETRRIIGKYILTYDDKINYRKFDDAVLRYEGGPSSDLHASSASKEDYMKYYKLFTADNNKRNDYCTMPYRCLLAKKNDNLFIAGRCASLDRITNAQLRVMGYCMMMGHAAGTAAGYSIKDNIAPEKIDIHKFQKQLKEEGIQNI